MSVNVQSKKTKVICCVMLAVALIVFGIVMTSLANANKGLKYGYATDGVVQYEQNRAGANKQKEDTCNTIAVISYIAGGVSALCAVIVGVKKQR